MSYLPEQEITETVTRVPFDTEEEALAYSAAAYNAPAGSTTIYAYAVEFDAEEDKWVVLVPDET